MNGIISLTGVSWISRRFHAKIIPALHVALIRDVRGTLFWRCTMNRNEKRAEARRLEQERNTGYVYLMRSENGYYKIGISKDVAKRLQSINYSIPIEIELIHSFRISDYQVVERFLHDKYSSKIFRYEWFKLDEQDIEWIKSVKDEDSRIIKAIKQQRKKRFDDAMMGLYNHRHGKG
jgi:hypothetical protein